LSAAAMRPVRRRHKAAGGLPAALHAVQGHLARVTLPAIFRTNTSMCAGWGRVWRRCRVSARLEHQLGVATRRERLRHGRVVHGGHQRVKARRADRDQHGAAARGRGRCGSGGAMLAAYRVGRQVWSLCCEQRAGRPRACAAGGTKRPVRWRLGCCGQAAAVRRARGRMQRRPRSGGFGDLALLDQPALRALHLLPADGHHLHACVAGGRGPLCQPQNHPTAGRLSQEGRALR